MFKKSLFSCNSIIATVITQLILSLSCASESERTNKTVPDNHNHNAKETPLYTETIKPKYNLSGSVELVGAVPKLQPIKISRMKKHCSPGSRANNALLVSRAGQIANAVVYIDINETAPYSFKGFNSPILDQKLCTFIPHVQIAAVGSKLLIKNTDPTMHSVHAYLYEDDTYFPQTRTRSLPAGKSVFNLSMPYKGLSRSKTLSQPGLLRLVCDVGHSWMQAYIWVAEHPFYAVTDSSGHFVIPEVPSGKWSIRVWHEYLGVLEKPIELKEDLEITISFHQEITKK